MRLQTLPSHRLILGITFTVTFILGCLALKTPPGADPDPCWGFQVMRSMEQGHPFNQMVSPDADNLAKNQSDFLSWWSPGQYLMPYTFKKLLGTNTGHGVALTIILCSFLGLAGFYQLFKRLGFTQFVSAASVAFIACQQFFVLPYIFYPGGEVLVFAFTGWFLYGCFGIKKLNWQSWVFVFLAGLIGFFAKSSVLWMFAAGLACIWINISAPFSQKNIKNWLINGVALAIPAICALAFIYVFYLSKGQNPANASAGWLFKTESFVFPLAAPLLSGFSFDEMFGGLIYHPGDAAIAHPLAILILILLATGSVTFVISVIRSSLQQNYKLALTVFYAVGTLFFTYMFLKQSAISFEGRHFRIIGLLAVPGVWHFFNQHKTSKIAFGAIWFLYLSWAVNYFVGDYIEDTQAPHSGSGLTQDLYDQETLTALSTLDKAHQGDAIFVVMNPDIACEINKNRVIILDVDDMTKDDLNELDYTGNGGQLLILMPTDYIANADAKAICKAFSNYHHFSCKKLSNAFYLYSAAN